MKCCRLDLGKSADQAKLPKIFHVNWFRRGDDRRFLWPGFRENSRVLKWIIDRVDGLAGADETPIGFLPRISDLDLAGLDANPADTEQALAVHLEEWRAELPLIEAWFDKIGDKIPTASTRTTARLLSLDVDALVGVGCGDVLHRGGRRQPEQSHQRD